jgi:hypothetical protein
MNWLFILLKNNGMIGYRSRWTFVFLLMLHLLHHPLGVRAQSAAMEWIRPAGGTLGDVARAVAQ